MIPVKYETHTSNVRSALRSKPKLVTVMIAITCNNGTKRITADRFDAYNGRIGVTHSCERPKWMNPLDWFIANMPENDTVTVEHE